MKFKLKKLIALGLTLAMTCSALSMPAYALDVVDETTISSNETVNTDETKGEETTPPTTESGEETTPPTTESGEETTPPTTESGGETTTPPTTEGGEETTTPPTTEGEETVTPPEGEVVDPGFGVDPELPEVLPPEGGEVDITPEEPPVEEIVPPDDMFLPQMSMALFSQAIEMYDASILPVYVEQQDTAGNKLGTTTVTMPDKTIIIQNKDKDIDVEGNHYECTNRVLVDGAEIQYIATISITDPENQSTVTYTYYSTDGRTAVELQDKVPVLQYKQYYKVNTSSTGNGSISVNNEKLYIDNTEFEYTITPDKGYYLTSFKVNNEEKKSEFGISNNGGTYEYKLPVSGDLNLTVDFDTRANATITALGLDGVSYPSSVEVGTSGGSWTTSEFQKTGDRIINILINDDILDFSLVATGNEYETITKEINGMTVTLKYKNDARRDSTINATTKFWYTISITGIYEDLNIDVVFSNTNKWLSTLTYTGDDNNFDLYYNKVTKNSAGQITREELVKLEPGSKLSTYERGDVFQFYIKYKEGYGNAKINKDGIWKYWYFLGTYYDFTISEVNDISSISGSSSETAKELGCTEYFTIKKFDLSDGNIIEIIISFLGGSTADSSFGLSVSKINYTINYDTTENGTIDGNPTRSAVIGDKITLPSCTPKDDSLLFVGWRGPDGKLYSAGQQFEINNITYILADENNTFNFTALWGRTDNSYTITHHFDNGSGEYENLTYTEVLSIGDTTSGEGRRVFAIPLTSMDNISTIVVNGQTINLDDYYYDSVKTNGADTGILQNNTGKILNLDVYYTCYKKIEYHYTNENGQAVKYTIKGVKENQIHNLYTAPVSKSSGDLYFAGWKDSTTGDTLYVAGAPRKIGKEATRIFTATYYNTSDFSGYNDNSEKLGYSTGKVDNGSIFNNDIQFKLGDNGSVYVYGSIKDTTELSTYDEIGFVYSIYNNAPTTVGGFSYSEDNCVYRNILIKNGEEKTLTKAADGTYLFGTRFIGTVPNKFIVTPYIVEEESGQIIYGTPKEITR